MPVFIRVVINATGGKPLIAFKKPFLKYCFRNRVRSPESQEVACLRLFPVRKVAFRDLDVLVSLEEGKFMHSSRSGKGYDLSKTARDWRTTFQ